MAKIAAIETEYLGYKFRSRLEARWACFFHTLNIPFEYEKEGFALGTAGWYLPDFWLPEQDCWVEIKGEKPNHKERRSLGVLANITGKIGFIFAGPITLPEDQQDYLVPSGEAYFSGRGWDFPYHWCECATCGAFGLQFDGRSDRLPCKSRGCTRSTHGDKGYASDTPRLLAAYTAARQERFDGGRNGHRGIPNPFNGSEPVNAGIHREDY